LDCLGLGEVGVPLAQDGKDLFDQVGKQPPKTIGEYHALARQFNTPMRAGTIKCLKTGDSVLNESHWYINALGEGWFDAEFNPIFHHDKGVQAIEALKEVSAYAQPGYTAAANDECMIALQQDLAAMGPQWTSRALAMEFRCGSSSGRSPNICARQSRGAARKCDLSAPGCC
jgi:hypothetical protein